MEPQAKRHKHSFVQAPLLTEAVCQLLLRPLNFTASSRFHLVSSACALDANAAKLWSLRRCSSWKRGGRPSSGPSSADGPGRDNHVSHGASCPARGLGLSPKLCHQGWSAFLRPRCRFFTAQAPFVSPLLGLPRGCYGVMVALWRRSVLTLGWSFPLGWC